jgi:glycosyltransferase involved in cell wall biosynthesis
MNYMIRLVLNQLCRARIQMHILFLTGSPAHYMAPPQLGDTQIVAGPDWPDAQSPQGDWISIKAPVGDYNIAALLDKLPADQQPDAVVSLVDASWRNTPRNLAAFRGPKALLVADTHHLASPLIGMLKYAATEPYDRIIFLYDRHHLSFFHSAGFKNLYWFPGLTFPHNDETVKTARMNKRNARLAFVGQSGKFHPHRARLLDAVKKSKLPLDQRRLSQRQALEFYGGSSIGFNASLNGDLNLRVFEIIASGAALLTDRLAPESGLFQLFTEGKEVFTYSSGDELIERAQHALSHPHETAEVGRSGAALYDRLLSAQVRRTNFQDLLVNGTQVPAFAEQVSTPIRKYFLGDTDRLLQGVIVYESVQELHRTEEKVRVVLTPSVEQDIADLWTSLPRIEIVREPVSTEAHMAIFSIKDKTIPTALNGQLIWCYDAQPEDKAQLIDSMAPAGFACVSEDVAMFCRVAKADADATEPKAKPGGNQVLLYTDDPDSGGVAQYNHSLMVGLTAAGYAVACAQTQSRNPLIDAQQKLGITHHWIPYDTKTEFVKTISDHATAETIIEAVNPGLIIFSDCCPVSNMAARDVALKLGVPYIVVVGFVGAYLADRFKSVLGRLALHYARARAVVAVSKENLELLQNHFGLPAHTGQVIHYGRPERFFAPQDEIVRARLRAELKLPAEAVVCFTAARLSAVKGYLYQILAAKHLVSQPGNEHLHFVWAGEGDQRHALEQAIMAADLSGRIHLLGHRWDMADWYDAADIFILPSDLEGMPLAIMEAMAKGLPVVATAVSGIPEELGDTGQLLPSAAENRQALVSQLVRTLNNWIGNTALRKSIGEAGRARAILLFRESRMIKLTVDLVSRQVCEESHATRRS